MKKIDVTIVILFRMMVLASQAIAQSKILTDDIVFTEPVQDSVNAFR